MSKNITISEGTQAKNFNNIHKLRTNLIGGGTQYWVPEDEAGDYAKLSEKSITANGTYTASDENKDGYSKVIVNVPAPEIDLITKRITANGTYIATDEGVDGYNQVIVTGIGNAVGVDPSDQGGDENEYYIHQNSECNVIEKTPLPSFLRIVTYPTKTQYNDGELIDISGIVVQAFMRDGTIWEDAAHPGGIIPTSELAHLPYRAHIDDEGTFWTNGQGVTAEMIFLDETIRLSNYRFDVNSESSYGLVDGRDLTRLGQLSSRNVGRLLVCEYNNCLYYKAADPGKQVGGLRVVWTKPVINPITRHFEPAVYSFDDGAPLEETSWWKAYTHFYDTTFIHSDKDPENSGELTSNGQKISIRWSRPIDNKDLYVHIGVTVHGTN